MTWWRSGLRRHRPQPHEAGRYKVERANHADDGAGNPKKGAKVIIVS